MNRFDPLRKLMHVDEAVSRHAAQPGTVFTHGSFDVLRRADIAFLAEARQLGDRLIVAIHGDGCAARGEGASAAPLHCEGDRAFHVAALESVDAVVILHEPSALGLLARLRPAVQALRGGSDDRRLAETALMQSWGGHAIALPFADGHAPAVTAAGRRDATVLHARGG